MGCTSIMGLKNYDNDNQGEGYTAFDSGDNAIVKISDITCELGSYQGSEYYQLHFVFDAVNELDEDDRGRIPAWMSSKVTVQESDTHTSDLAKMLMEADAVDEVVDGLHEDGVFDAALEDEDVPFDSWSELREAILDEDSDPNFEAETDEENRLLGKAVAQALKGKVFRVSTDHNSSGEYSKVDKVNKLMQEKESLFDGFDVSLEFDHTLDDGSDAGESEESSSDSTGSGENTEKEETGVDDEDEVIFSDGEEESVEEEEVAD